jgi:CBS domain containing-hemolysin-like protein
MLLTWTVIFGLILLTALYVAAEFGAVSVRRSRLRRLAEDGHTLAQRLLPIVEDPRELDRYIAASQIGITLGSLILGAYGQATLSETVVPWLTRVGMEPEVARSSSPAVVLVSLTTLAMILGELVPKSLALQYPTATAIGTYWPMDWSLRVFAPFIWLLNGTGILLLRLFGVENSGHRHIHSPDELELLIAESRDGGLLEADEQQRLHRALRLGLRTARQLMVPRDRLVTVSADLPFEEIVNTLLAAPYTRLPVYRGSPDNILGTVRTKDVVVHFVEHGIHGRVESLLRPIPRVREELPADKLLAFMREQRAHQALVIDPRGTLAGLVTLQDVLSDLLGQAGAAAQSKPAGRDQSQSHA